MVPAFGFSAGDFISAIELTIKIIKALRETGGASAECRMVLQDLQNLQQVLQLLQDLRPADGNLSHVNAIRGLAITCLIPLKEFAEKIDRSYGSMASVSSSDHVFRRSSKKVQWTIFAVEEVAKFRSVVAAKVASIGLLLGIFNNESLSRIEAQNRESKDSLLAKAAEHRHSLERNLSKSIVSHHNALSKQLSETGKSLKAELSGIEEQAQSRHYILLREADQHTRKLEGLSRQIGQVQKDTYSSTKDIMGLCLGATAGTERIEDEMTSIRKQQNDISSHMLDHFRSVFFHLKMVGMAGASVLGCLIPFSEKVLRYLRENMKANIEIYALLLRIQSSMPKQLNNGDQFHFEDVLGRTKNLPYEYFRHWEVFESMLRCEFRGFPGEAKVLQGQYLLLGSTLEKDQIDKDAWRQRVFPGSRVKMSILMQDLGVTSGFCPRPSCNGRVDGLKWLTVHHCPACGLAFVPQRSLHTEGQGLDVAWPGAMLSSNREESRTPLSKEVILSDEVSIAERRKQREFKAREKAERELQEIMVFRMVHVLQSSGGMQPKYVPKEVEDILSDISADVYQEKAMHFTGMYRKIYMVIWRKTHARILYEKLASVIPTYIEDLMDYHLQKELEKADNGGNGFDAATLAKISRLWQTCSRTLVPMTDCLMYLDRAYCTPHRLPTVVDIWHEALRNLLGRGAYDHLKKGIESSAADFNPESEDLRTCLDMIHVLERT